MGERDFLFIGHRTTGKSTLARELASRGWNVIDLDEVIETSERKTCAEIIAQSERRFRDLEHRHLSSLARDSHERPRIIVVGAGCLSLPDEPIAIWLKRDGWVDSARLERARLKPGSSFAEEVEWMRTTREPVWQSRADMLYEIPRGRSVERSADLLEPLLRWVDAEPGVVARKTWLLAPDDDSLPRCEARVRRLGLAGVEIRSDLVEDPACKMDVPILASLRTRELDWLDEAWSRHGRVDLDLEVADLHSRLPMRDETTLIFSAHPEEGEWRSALTRLRDYVASTKSQSKFAPAVSSASEVRSLLEQTRDIDTLIPQGLAWAWLRPLLACEGNALNYLPLGLAGHRVGEESVPPLDLRDWLAHLALDQASTFDALLGNPAWPSQGDVWHRKAALVEGNYGSSYVKIDAPTDDFEDTIELARIAGVRGFSITSPFKRDAAELAGAEAALNTLKHRGERWVGQDTDQAGMQAQLAWIAAEFDVELTCSLLGKGGVSKAALRGIEAAGWKLMTHRGAREGWTGTEVHVGLVINAAGKWGYDVPNPPACNVWLDLHYADTRTPPVDAIHVIGDVFFDAQARAQREFWAS